MGVTLRQFEQMKARVSSPGSDLAAPAALPTIQPGSPQGVILGVDPSLRGTGFGVIQTGRIPVTLLAAGTIKCPRDWTHSRCLGAITSKLRDVADQFQPRICVVEGLFHAQNLKTALIMGEARGAAIAAVSMAGLEVFEIAPRKVKQAIVGYGAARKIAVARMVQRMLNLDALPAPDAADALALALAYAQTRCRMGPGMPRRI
jgi:crossover junction endodeoxyribonuclease RuvC